MIEFMPWYHPNAQLLRCGGDDGCGALLVSGDIEVHARFHDQITTFRQALAAAHLKVGLV